MNIRASLILLMPLVAVAVENNFQPYDILEDVGVLAEYDLEDVAEEDADTNLRRRLSKSGSSKGSGKSRRLDSKSSSGSSKGGGKSRRLDSKSGSGSSKGGGKSRRLDSKSGSGSSKGSGKTRRLDSKSGSGSSKGGGKSRRD